jgi:hypothetical protein
MRSARPARISAGRSPKEDRGESLQIAAKDVVLLLDRCSGFRGARREIGCFLMELSDERLKLQSRQKSTIDPQPINW